MGQKSSRTLPLDEAVKLLTEEELATLRKTYQRLSRGSNGIDSATFSQYVLGPFLPRALVSQVYAAFDPSSSRGISSSHFISGIAVFTRGTPALKTQFAFNVYDYEGAGYLTEDDFARLLLPEDGGRLPDSLANFFGENETMSFEQFNEWVNAHPAATSLVQWIFLPNRKSDPDDEPASFISTLAKLTEFSEKDVTALDRCFWAAKSKGTGKFDATLLRQIACPPLTPRIATRFCEVIDKHKEGQVHSREFICGLGECCGGSDSQKLEFCFRFFDVDHDQQLNHAEVQQLFATLAELDRRNELAPSRPAPSSASRGSSESDSESEAEEPSSLSTDFHLPIGGEAESTAASKVLTEWSHVHPDALVRDEFVAWASDSGALRPLLQALQQMLYVSLGLKPATVRQQAAAIRPLIIYHNRLGQVPGSTSYVTSSQWWQAFKAHVGLEKRDSNAQAPHPGPIDNVTLVKSSGGVGSGLLDKFLDKPTYSQFGSKLKRTTQGSQFVLLPEHVWVAVHSWYGGGPILPRPVLQHSNGKIDVELFPITLRILRHSHTSATRNGVTDKEPSDKPPSVHSFFSIECSRGQTVRQVTNYVAIQQRKCRGGKAGLRADDVRLWDYRSSDNPKLLENLKATIEDCSLEENQQVLLEVRNEDLSWPSELYAVSKAQAKGALAVETKQASSSDLPRGLTGLSNLGNTCFLNSGLQCLSNCEPLREYFRKKLHLYELNKTNPLGCKGTVARRYGDLISQLWSGKSSVAPVQLRRVIAKHREMFNDYLQHDAQELLAVLLDCLHEDLNRVFEKPYVERKDSDGRPDKVVAAEDWEAHLMRNQSLVVDLFHGQFRSSVECKVCGFSSVTFDPFTFLQVPLPTEHKAVADVTVHLLDGSVPVRYSVETERDPLYKDVRDAVADLAGLDPRELCLTEIHGPIINSIHRSSSKVRKGAAGSFTAFQLDKSVLPAPELVKPDEEKPQDPEPPAATKAVSDAAPDVSPASPSSAPRPSDGVSTPEPKPANGAPNRGARARAARPKPLPLLRSIPNHMIGIHRKRLRREENVLLHQCRPMPFGTPVMLPCVLGKTTCQDLYESVWEQVKRFVTSTQRTHVEQTKEPLMKYPFKLRLVNLTGSSCAICPWNRFCLGCSVQCVKAPFSGPMDARIAIDWNMVTYFLHYESPEERRIVEHKSIEEHKKRLEEPVDIEECVAAFSKEEELDEEDNWYCSKCKKHQRAKKQLKIWSLPPFLIVHLKRFRAVNGAWVKSQKRVRFPLKGFIPRMAENNKQKDSEVASPNQDAAAEESAAAEGQADQVNQVEELEAADELGDGAAQDDDLFDSDPELDDKMDKQVEEGSAKADIVRCDNDVDIASRADPDAHADDQVYDLYAVSNHVGILGGGHYVSYACNPNGKWYLFNDSTVKEIPPERVTKESSYSYMLFYKRRDLDSAAFLPTIDPERVAEIDADEIEFGDGKSSNCVVQ